MSNIFDDYMAVSFALLPEEERAAGRKALLWLCSTADYNEIQAELHKRAEVFGTIQVFHGWPMPITEGARFCTIVYRGYHTTVVDAGFASTGICAMPSLTVPNRANQ